MYTENIPFVSIFKYYLDRRSQYVYVNDEYSTEGIARFGVPQGSVLYPLLFCSFVLINDLPMHITSDIVNCDMFADDTTHNASTDHYN